jgi:hypothetical protein
MWANSSHIYRKNAQIVEMTGMPIEPPGSALTAGALSTTRYKASSGFNGLLHTLSTTEVGSPSKVPMLWPVQGAINHDGLAYSAPYLDCPNTNLGCRFNPSGTAQGGVAANGFYAYLPWYTAFGGDYTYWMYGKSVPITYTDTSAKVIQMFHQGAFVSSLNIWNEPYSMHNGQGIEWQYYGCSSNTAAPHAYYPCYFRPDRDVFGQG